MSLRVAVPLLLLVFAPGCVPTPDPVGDIDAKPDERIFGTWTNEGTTFVIDRSPVKGHPKGLLRMRVWEKNNDPTKGDANETDWLFTATVGKHTYGNMLLSADPKQLNPALGEEGAYEKWLKSEKKGYFVGLFTFDRDTLTLDGGDEKAFDALMVKEKIKKRDGLHAIPVGWFTKYFEKNGPDAIFTGKSASTYTRVKQK
jgi:hypothetical protein